MYVVFDDISSKARVWIFLADRILSDEEQQLLKDKSITFIQQWTSHQQEVKGSYALLHDAVWVIAADNAYAQVGGCSTDSLLRFVQDTQQLLNVDFFDRKKVLLLSNGRAQVCPMDRLSSTDSLNDYHILNPLIDVKEDMATSLFLPFAKSRYASLV